MTTFSKVTTLVSLQNIPGSRAFNTRTRPVTMPSPEFTDTVFGDFDDEQRRRVAYIYRELLLPQSMSKVAAVEVPSALLDIF